MNASAMSGRDQPTRRGRGKAGNPEGLAAALRANLKRRKRQARGREADAAGKGGKDAGRRDA